MDTENCCLGGQKCFNYYEQVDRQTSLFVRVVNFILAPGLRECETRQVSGSSHRVLQGKLTWKLQIQSCSLKKYVTLTFSHQDHEIPYCRVERKTQAAVIHRLSFIVFLRIITQRASKRKCWYCPGSASAKVYFDHPETLFHLQGGELQYEGNLQLLHSFNWTVCLCACIRW